MGSVFWDGHGIIFIDYVEKGRKITGAYYATLLDRLVDEIRKKRPHLKKKKILFHDDNAPSNTSNIAQSTKHELGFESLPIHRINDLLYIFISSLFNFISRHL